jgi:hypothetical protein
VFIVFTSFRVSLFFSHLQVKMFSNNEYADIHLVLGECRNNATAAARLYRERYPLRRRPSSSVFRRLDHRIRETGSVVPKGVFYRDRGRPKTARTPQIEDNVLDLKIQQHLHVILP